MSVADEGGSKNAGAAQLADWDAKDAPLGAGNCHSLAYTRQRK
jgi:hypothetical protein